MRFLLGGVVVVFTLALVIGALTGRVRARSCCGGVDASRDLRLRAAGWSDPRAAATTRPADRPGGAVDPTGTGRFGTGPSDTDTTRPRPIGSTTSTGTRAVTTDPGRRRG